MRPESRDHDENGILNAFRYRALGAAAELHYALGQHEAGGRLDAEAAVVKASMINRL